MSSDLLAGHRCGVFNEGEGQGSEESEVGPARDMLSVWTGEGLMTTQNGSADSGDT
jgi:hypothetical protein